MARKEVPTPHEAYMMGHRHGSAGKPAKPPDPGKDRGDGMREAQGKPRDSATEKGRPSKAPDPQKVRGDGMKTAMRGEGRRSEVSPMRAAREMVR
jgi:hypothetical protein